MKKILLVILLLFVIPLLCVFIEFLHQREHPQYGIAFGAGWLLNIILLVGGGFFHLIIWLLED